MIFYSLEFVQFLKKKTDILNMRVWLILFLPGVKSYDQSIPAGWFSAMAWERNSFP